MRHAIDEVIAAFSSSTTMHAYKAAKRYAARLAPADQLLIIDAAIEARRRIERQLPQIAPLAG